MTLTERLDALNRLRPLVPDNSLQAHAVDLCNAYAERLAEVGRDARRYRWLRQLGFGKQIALGVPYENEAGGRSVEMQCFYEAGELDAAIDAAIEQEKP